MKLIKKILISMLTVAILLTGSHISFYAQETEVEVLDVGLEITENDEIFLETESQGRQIMESQSSNSRSVSLLFTVNRLVQSDSRWSSVQLGTSNETIGSAGCCLTSFTMIRNYLSGTSDTPASVNSRLGSFANPFDYGVAASRYGYTSVGIYHSNAGLSASKAESTIIGALTQYNVPVLVGVRTLSGSTHFVVASGYASTNDIIIRDPASRNYTKLNQYLDAGYYVHRIYCFTK